MEILSNLQLGAVLANVASSAGRNAPAPQSAPAAPSPVDTGGAQAPEAAPVAAEVPDPEEAQAVVARIAEFLRDSPVGFEYVQDAHTGRMLLRILDRETKQVIRQIPPEEILAVTRALDRYQSLLHSEKA